MASPNSLVGPPIIYKHVSSYSINPLSPPKQNPCVDLFYSQNLLKNLPTLLKESWDYNPTTTLKIVFTILSVDAKRKEAFLEALLWIYHNHPLTLVLNLNVFHNLGCIKNLLDMLCIIVHGDQNKEGGYIAMAKKVVHKFANDPNYRMFHNKIAIFFAENLEDDLQLLAKGQIEKISLASKLCPSLNSFYDKRTLMCEAIARMLFPRELEEYQGIQEAHYAYRIRDRLRRDVLVPLRKALNGANQLTSVKSRNALFKKDGKKLFKIYQKEHKRLYTNGEKLGIYLYIANNIKCKALIKTSPYGIITSLNDGGYENDVAEQKWQNVKDEFARRGRWKNCLAICNVSNAKASIKDFSIGMSLLLSELCEVPWKGQICTFHNNPQLKRVEGSDLKSKITYLKGLSYAKNIRFSKVFDEILECAISQKVIEEHMIRKIFVLVT
ncbi:hypothetical protein LIER_25429 [Lithospermum erythrorhizon]|uniref:Uncharacterized protein n=1 Tax=Lithospermum erythrorhizon TaxID=34254 RepID=A0AAV3R4Y7_LITER